MLKNQSIQPHRRLWRTPSPSLTGNIKSSARYLRSGLFNKNFSKNLKTQINTQFRSKPMLHSFKNQLVQMKQQANKTMNVNPQQSIQEQQRPLSSTAALNSQQKQSPNTIPFPSQQQPYQLYYSKLPKPSSIPLPTTSQPQVNPKQREQIPSLMRNRSNRYEEELRRHIEENARLVEDYRLLMGKYEGLLAMHGQVCTQMEDYRRQYEGLKAKYEEKNVVQKLLGQQILAYKKAIQNHKIQYSSYTTQKLKLRQQVSQLKQSLAAPKPCPQCKTSQKTIISLNNALQNKMYEIGKKDSMISSLCADLHKLDNEIKMYDKPKAVFKKMGSNAEEINEMLMVSKARELSARMRALEEQAN